MNTEDRLKQIEKIAQNARSTWFGLLALVLFVGITLMAHEDADFFAHGAATTLPLINIQVPPTAFYLAAPLFTAAIYCYLHIFLFSLWEALGKIEQKEGAEPLSDRVFPTLFTVAGLIYRNSRRRDGCIQRLALANWTVALAIVLGWLFPPAVVGLAWWMSAPAHEWLTTAVAGFGFACSLCVCFMSFMVAHDYLSGTGGERTSRLSAGRIAMFLGLLASVGGIGLERTTLNHNGFLASADLVEARLTQRPADWKPFEFWLRDHRLVRDDKPTEQDPLIPTEQEMQRYKLWLASLDAPTLRGRDLRSARMKEAFLPSTDLRWAQMQGAVLIQAQMQGADLREAQMQGARFFRAQIQGADLRGAHMKEVGFNFAQMHGAIFNGAQMQGAFLIGAQMQRADLGGAYMQGADLARAQMQGADLSGAHMAEAVLREAQLQGTDLRDAQMYKADLWRAQLLGANLRKASLQGASLSNAKMRAADLRSAEMAETNCDETSFIGALVHSADLTCGGSPPLQAHLNWAVGDKETKLPSGLWVQSCLDRSKHAVKMRMVSIESALAYVPGDRKAEFEHYLWCQPNHDDPLRRTMHPFGDQLAMWRFWKSGMWRRTIQ